MNRGFDTELAEVSPEISTVSFGNMWIILNTELSALTRKKIFNENLQWCNCMVNAKGILVLILYPWLFLQFFAVVLWCKINPFSLKYFKCKNNKHNENAPLITNEAMIPLNIISLIKTSLTKY